VKVHKKGTIITAAIATAVGTGAFVYNKMKNYEPKIVTEFREALRVYIDACCNCCGNNRTLFVDFHKM